MSLTSRRIHRLVVPVLFRDVAFYRAHDVGFHSVMERLIRNIMRARFLFNSPELTRHTRFFTFWEDSLSIEECLARREDSDGSSSKRDVENFLAVIHDVIFPLIFRMPGLRELRLRNLVMSVTPFCYAAISSCPLLTSLYLVPRRIPDITHITPALPGALRLRDFDYHCHDRTINDPPDPYLTDILDHCILNLENLSISPVLLPLVVSRIPLHRTLSLQSLYVSLPLHDGPVVTAFLQVLHASPQLRHLDVRWELHGVEPAHYLPLPLFPNLSTFLGTPLLSQIVSGGTNLVNIIIYDCLHVQEQPLTQILRSSPTHLREISVGRVIVSETPHEFLAFIRSFAAFRNLETLTMAYEHDTSRPWKDHVSAQNSKSAITDLLSQLVCLRFLDINCGLFGLVEGHEIGCPLSKEGEPADRGHPTLETFYVDFLCGLCLWSWDSRTGWEIQ